MARTVLGNDPFSRSTPRDGGAQARPSEPAGRSAPKKTVAAEGAAAKRPKQPGARRSTRAQPALGRSPTPTATVVRPLEAPPAQLGPAAAPREVSPAPAEATPAPLAEAHVPSLVDGSARRASYERGHSARPPSVSPLDNDLIRRSGPFVEFLHRRYWRVDATGAAGLPRDGGLIVANHGGTLPFDVLMLMHTVRRARNLALRPLVEEPVRNLPYLGRFLARLGAVRASRENAEHLLLSGELAAVFPEGVNGLAKPYHRRYQLQAFGRGGFARVALRTGKPIIPTAIVGAEETQPVLARLPWSLGSLGFGFTPVPIVFPVFGPAGLLGLPTKWSIAFGEPILTAHRDPAEADDPNAVRRLTSQVRDTVQRMLNEGVAQRRSVWFG